MYSTISIRKFRGIQSLDASGFRRINLILGRNNSGKTTFLESLLLLGAWPDAHLTATIGQLRGQRFRGKHADPIWRALFHNLEPDNPAEIRGYWTEQHHEMELKIEAMDYWYGDSEPDGGVFALMRGPIVGLVLHSKDVNNNPISSFVMFDSSPDKIQLRDSQKPKIVPSTFLSARSYPSPLRDAQQFSSILKNKHDTDVIDALRSIEPSVERVEILSESSGPSIYLDIGLKVLVPLAVCGEGLVRLFSLILALIESRDGVLLVDEIDNGLHYSVMPKLWKLLGKLVVKHNVQVFGTTHNEDIIRSGLEAFADEVGMLGLFRIDERGDRHVMVGYSEEAMQAVREERFEVRG